MSAAVDVLLALVVASLGVDVLLGRTLLRLRDRVLALELELEHGERRRPGGGCIRRPLAPRDDPVEELWLE